MSYKYHRPSQKHDGSEPPAPPYTAPEAAESAPVSRDYRVRSRRRAVNKRARAARRKNR